MAAASDYLEKAVLDHVLKNTAYTQPTVLEMALFTDTATLGELELGTLTNEVANSNAYARTTVAFDAAATPGGTTQNTGAVTFPAASGGNWGTVRFAAVMDNATHGAGNVLFYGQLTADKIVNDGDTFKFNIGDIDIALA